MAVPSLRRVLPFPATESHTFHFDVAGASQQIFYNELEIKKANNNDVVYLKRIQEFRYQHTLHGDSTIITLESVDADYIEYTLPEFIDTEKQLVVYLDGQEIIDGFLIDGNNKVLTFDASLKNEIAGQMLTPQPNYRVFYVGSRISDLFPIVVYINDNPVNEEDFIINYEQGYIEFNDALDELTEETLLSMGNGKYQIDGDYIKEKPLSVYVDSNLVTDGYILNASNNTIQFYQRINREKTVASNDFTVYTAQYPFLEDEAIEVYVDGMKINEGYTVDYTGGKITFFLPPHPFDADTNVEISYKKSFSLAPSAEVKVEYYLYDKEVKIDYTEHIPEVSISQNFLRNGEQYYATVRIYNRNQDLLGQSSPIFFYCFSLPETSIPTIVNGEVGNQTVLFEGQYYQAENELLQSYKFTLYGDHNSEIATSGEVYSEEIQYEFSELENRRQYYIELAVTTVNEMVHSTGLIGFTPRYIAPRFNSAIQLTNLSDEASVLVECNVVRVIGIPDIEPIEYIGQDRIDLRNNGIWFDEGFKLRGNWTIQMWLGDILPDATFFKLLANDGSHLKLQYEDGKINLYKMLDDEYILQFLAGDVNIDTDDKDVFICLKHVDGLFDLMYEEVMG